MPKFRVFGNLLKEFVIDIEAADSEQAYEIANSASTDHWSELETDNIIEPVDVIQDLSVGEE